MKKQILKDLGEEAVIRLIHETGAPGSVPPYVKKGIGDDAAVLEVGGDRVVLVTADTLVEGTHFTVRTLPYEALGWKSLAVNISDIAAMGGRPRTAFLSLGLRPDTAVSALKSFMAGFRRLACEAGIVLAGGDVVEVKSSAIIGVTLLGDCRAEQVVYRCGAQIGDDIWVSGPLGQAAAGLFLLLKKDVPSCAEYKSLVLCHQKPIPRYELGRALGERGLAHAMIDLSDGIAKDLGHICFESNTGAMVRSASVPLSRELMKLAAEVRKSPLDWALHGGEDYELLFTASSACEAQILSLTEEIMGKSAVKIGRVTRGEGLWLEGDQGGRSLKPGGFTHFS